MGAMTKAEIGRALLRLYEDVVEEIVSLARQFRTTDARLQSDMIKQAVDTPHRARARIDKWIADYDGRNGGGAAVAFLGECLAAAGSSKTLGDINTEIATLEAQAQTVVERMHIDGWTFEQVADAIDAQFVAERTEEFTYRRLPLPKGYTTVFGEPY